MHLVETVQGGAFEDSTLTVTPWFGNLDKVKVAPQGQAWDPELPSGAEPLWWSSWLDGADSGPSGAGSHISSFEALDQLIDFLEDTWPSLKHITIAGFSAG